MASLQCGPSSPGRYGLSAPRRVAANLITEVDAWALANARAASCCEAMMAITCGISASDESEPSYVQNVNLLHIPFRT